MTTNTSITSGQSRQIVQFGSVSIEKALEALGLDKDGAQRVIEHGDEFSLAVNQAALAALRNLSVSNQYADEEIETSYTYPNGYAVKDIAEQVALLVQIFPQLNAEATFRFLKETLPNLELPKLAEGWFAIPRWQKLASSYGDALKLVLAKIGESRRFYDYLEGRFDTNRLRQHARTVAMMEKIESAQPGDILIIPAQFGKRHAGRSVRRAREVVVSNEFLLGSVANGSMLLTHPPRLQVWEQLHVDCGGDERSPGADGQFDSAPYFSFDDGKVEFSNYWVSGPSLRFGSSSGFVSQ